jgi:hypothetical protein
MEARSPLWSEPIYADHLHSLRRLIVEQEMLADRLVLLEEIPHALVHAAAQRLEADLAHEHSKLSSQALRDFERAGSDGLARQTRLIAEHVAFADACEELRRLVELVERDGHGGNRQALGQFWRLLLESVRRHLDDERDLSPGRVIPGLE